MVQFNTPFSRGLVTLLALSLLVAGARADDVAEVVTEALAEEKADPTPESNNETLSPEDLSPEELSPEELSEVLSDLRAGDEFINGVTGMYMSFGQWCSETFCNLRLFTIIGGEALMIDSGSSSTAFCEPPNPDFVTNLSRVFVYDEENELRNISQCTKYGSGTHGWIGETYTGTMEVAGNLFPGSVFTIMQKHVGLTGNQCGPILEGSVGLEDDKIRGIMGIGGNDKFSYSDEANVSSWTDSAIDEGRCSFGDCKCPRKVVTGIPSGFLASLWYSNITKFALTWDGTIGENSGKYLWNEAAEKNILEGSPKVPIVVDPEKSYGLFSCNVTAIYLNGNATDVPPQQYFYDTGSGYISVPEEIFYDLTDGSVLSFVFPTNEYEFEGVAYNETFMDVTVTQELIDARVFRPAGPTSKFFFGLNIHRYTDNILINMNLTDPYFQSRVRESPILAMPADLPLGNLIGSKSNDTFTLDTTNVTTGENQTDNSNWISQTIMNVTSGATKISSNGVVLLNAAIAVAATLSISIF